MKVFYPVLLLLLIVILIGLLLFVLDRGLNDAGRPSVASGESAGQGLDDSSSEEGPGRGSAAGGEDLSPGGERSGSNGASLSSVVGRPTVNAGDSANKGPASKVVHGQVVNESREPVEGALVSVVRILAPGKTSTVEQTTKDDGLFYFILEDGQTYSLSCEKDGFVPVKLKGGYSGDDPIVVMKPNGKLVGRVEDERGRPVRFAQVDIRSGTEGAPGRFMLTMQAGQDGRFETREELLPGTYTVAASLEEYYDIGKGRKEVQLRYPPEETVLGLASNVFELSGRVEEYGTGKGVPGMKVVLWAWGFGGTYNGQMGVKTSDENGDFTFADIPPGEYVASGWEAEDPNSLYRFTDARQAIASMRHGPVDPIVLYAAKAVRISGTVVDENQMPVAEAGVMSVEPSGAEAVTGEDGRFVLNIARTNPKGVSEYQLMARKSNESGIQYAFGKKLESREGEPIANVVLVLESGVRLSGRVLNPNDEPIEGAAVRVKNQFSGDAQETKSDGEGRYEFLNLMRIGDGDTERHFTYTLRVEAEGYSRALHFLTPQRGEKEMTRDVVLSESMTIAGRVTDSENRPLENVHVNAALPGCPGYEQLTGSDGRYLFENLTSGKYDLLFQYTERPFLTGYLRGVGAGSENADIELSFRAIALRVNLELHEDIDRSERVYAVLLKKNEDGTFSERNGVYVPLNSSSISIMIWEAGTYQLRCYVPNCPMASAWVIADANMEGDSIDITVPIGPPSAMNTIVGTIEQIEGFTCRSVVEPLGGQARVGEDGRFRLENVPDGFVDLVLWVCDDETGLPINVDALMDREIRGGVEMDVGVIPVGRYLDVGAFR